MTNDIRLYIGSELVEFDKVPDINYNWQETDFSNPITTKNSYSKTITVKGTKKNNDIFGHYWNLERNQDYGEIKTGVYYNPTYRVPFTLYVDGTLFQKGYVKLQKIKRNNGVISYEIGLFGGLGSFLYNLSTNWSKGTTKTLGDLIYYKGNSEVDLGFTINRTTVKNAWDNIENENSVYSIINFAPMYTGVPNSLDGDKVLINFNGISGLTTSKTEGNITYRLFSNSYSIGKLDSKIDMFEAKDLRSYLQTPVIRVKSIFDALCRPINNKGEFDDGYQVVLDSEWFNSNNPYYENAFMTLPQISSLVEATSANYELTDSTIVVQKGSFDNYFTINYELPEPITETGSHARLVYKLRADVNSTDSPLVMTNKLPDSDNPINAIAAQMYAISNAAGVGDDAETVLGGSLINWYTSPSMWEDFVQSDSNTFRPKFQPSYGGITYLKNAKWTYDTSTSSAMDYIFNEDNGYIVLEMDIPVGTTNIRFNVQRLNKGDDDQVAAEVYKDNDDDDYLGKKFDSTLYPYYSEGVLQVSTLTGASNTMISGKKVSKERLLSTSYSVADWLMSYCKMFGLYIHKDLTEDIIYIDTRNSFYNRNKVEDISKLIDYSKEIYIIPTNVDAKFYTLTTSQEETDMTKKYSNTWGTTYGMKKIDTGYDFDANSKELLKSSLKGAIDNRKQSLYNLKPINGINPYVYNGFAYTLYETEQISGSTTDIDVTKRQISSIYQTQHYNNNAPYMDFMNRVCLENEQKAAKTEDILVFYRGMQSIDSSYGFYLTDDMAVMNILNNKSCWIMTGAEYANNGDTVAISLTNIPRFSRYWETGNDVITYSMDYGSPRELYIDFTNNDDANLYSLFYKKYLEDLYDVNTKVVECYIKPEYLLTEDSLRSFYWFANSIWRLNKVVDYSPVGNRTVKCQFVKIQSLNNMTSEVPSAGPTMTVTLNQYTIGYMGGSINGRVETSDGRTWRYVSSDTSGVSVSPTTGVSGGQFTVTLPENTGKVARRITLTFAAGEITRTVAIQQEARKLIEISAATPVVAEASALTYDLVTNPGAIIRTYRHNDLLQVDELIQTQSFEEGLWTGNTVPIPINNTYSAVTYYISGITTDDMLSALTTVIQSASAKPETYITISGYTTYPASATRITYSVACYPSATIYIYREHNLIGTTNVNSGETPGLFINIEPNTETAYPITYYISGVTSDNQRTTRLVVYQAASAETTLLVTASSPIPAAQTYISYDLISNASSFVYLYKDGVMQGSNSHASGEWRNMTFNIAANTGFTPISYVLSARTADNSKTASVEVIQEATGNLVITGATPTIPYSATSFVYTLRNSPSARVTVIKDGVSQSSITYAAGERDVTVNTSQNTTMSAITFVISGFTTDSAHTASYTVTHLPNTSVVLTATSPIPAAQTYVSYGLTANANTTIYLLKNGSLVTSTSKSAGSYADERFSVNANTTYSSITYTISAVTSDNKGATATVIHSGVPEPEKHLTITAPATIAQSVATIPWSADTYPTATIAFFKNHLQSGSTQSIPTGLTNGSWYVGQNTTYSAITYVISGVTTSDNKTGSTTIVQAGMEEPDYVKYADDSSAKTDTYTSTAGSELYDLVTNLTLTELRSLTINNTSWLVPSFTQNGNNFFLSVAYTANNSPDPRSGNVDVYSGSTKVLTLGVTQDGKVESKYLVLKGDGVTIPATSTTLTWGYSANCDFNVYFYKDGTQVDSTSKTSGDVSNISTTISQNVTTNPVTWVISGVNSTYGVSDRITITQQGVYTIFAYTGNTGTVTAATVDATGGSFTVRVISNQSWTGSSNQSWVTLSKSTGSGDDSLTATVSGFTDSTARDATITFTAAHGETAQISVHQNGANKTFLWTTVMASAITVDVPATGGTISVAYTTNYTLNRAYGVATWIPSESRVLSNLTGDGVFTAVVEANTTNYSRDNTLDIITGSTLLTSVGKITVRQAAPSNTRTLTITPASSYKFFASSGLRSKSCVFSFTGASTTSGSFSQGNGIVISNGSLVMGTNTFDVNGSIVINSASTGSVTVTIEVQPLDMPGSVYLNGFSGYWISPIDIKANSSGDGLDSSYNNQKTITLTFDSSTNIITLDGSSSNIGQLSE